MRNLAEVRIRVSGEVFELMRSKLGGVVKELDYMVINILPSKDIELQLNVPHDEKNMESFEDLLEAYRLILRYLKKLEGVEARGTPNYSFQFTRGSFE